MVDVDGDRVPVARTGAAAFDGSVQRNRVGPGVALVGVVETSRILGLRSGHRDERNPDGPSVPEPEPKSAWTPVVAPMVLT